MVSGTIDEIIVFIERLNIAKESKRKKEKVEQKWE